jgi:hypothetical protein
VVYKLVVGHHVVDAMGVITSLKDRWPSPYATHAFQAAYNLPMFDPGQALWRNSVLVET